MCFSLNYSILQTVFTCEYIVCIHWIDRMYSTHSFTMVTITRLSSTMLIKIVDYFVHINFFWYFWYFFFSCQLLRSVDNSPGGKENFKDFNVHIIKNSRKKTKYSRWFNNDESMIQISVSKQYLITRKLHQFSLFSGTSNKW